MADNEVFLEGLRHYNGAVFSNPLFFYQLCLSLLQAEIITFKLCQVLGPTNQRRLTQRD